MADGVKSGQPRGITRLRTEQESTKIPGCSSRNRDPQPDPFWHSTRSGTRLAAVLGAMALLLIYRLLVAGDGFDRAAWTGLRPKTIEPSRHQDTKGCEPLKTSVGLSP
jgi:hypothetical protein